VGAFTASIAWAEALSEKAIQTFNGRAGQMISAADSDPSDAETYIAGLKSSCTGLIGDLMSARVPNSAGIQLQSFCMGVNDLERAGKANKSGRNAYCGDFDQGIKAARKMTPNDENQAIYGAAQSLADAAEKIKSIEFATSKRVGWGLGAATKAQTMTCK